MDEEPMGMLYFSNDLYGDDMTRLQEALREAGFELHIDSLEDEADLMKIENAGENEGDEDLTLHDAHIKEVNVILAGLASIQERAFHARDIEKLAAAGNSIGKLAKENPDLVREAFLLDRESFRIASFPDEILEHLDLKLRDGTLFENTDGDGWTEVEIDE